MKSNNTLKVITDKNFNEVVIKSQQPVLVEFASDWYGSCHIVDPVIKRVAKEFQGQIKFCKIDAVENKKTVDRYCVRDLPTLLFFNKGEIVDHFIGAISNSELLVRLEALLETP